MLKEIDLAGALARMKDGSEKICMLVPVSKDTTLEELMQAKGFALADTKKEEPKPKAEKPKRNIDTGKILALHNAGWTASAIASEIGCSTPTVTKYINAKEKA
ncbi:MAG TPA: hypothetical protein DEV97_02140 [Lachnospiraceae bacterium]|nr:hypothetical protein [Lachnospiraceae bacterium]